MELNTEQMAVVDAPLDVNMVVIACAGSGKTTTILRRIEKMISRYGVKPTEITLTTFTVEATRDIKGRLGKDAKNIQIGTIDAIARGTLQKYAYDWISKYKIMSVAEYGPLFLKFLTQHPNRHKYLATKRYLIVDEYQDINSTQYKIFRKFYETNHIKLTVIGDDSQNIYSFRGSDVQYIVRFETTFSPTKRFILSKNYRSSHRIVEVANSSIQINRNQIPKDMIPHTKNMSLPKPQIHGYGHALDQFKAIVGLIERYGATIPLDQIVVLCRMTKPLYAIEAMLEQKQISNQLLDGKDRPNGGVTLCSIHKSKGLEWMVVIILECNERYFPMIKTSIKDIEEERRLFYVAVTRAKQYLHFTYTSSYGPSRFLTELDSDKFITTTTLQPKAHSDDIDPNNEYASSLAVTRLVRRLDGDDFLELREQNILKNFIFESFSVSKPITSPKWVIDKKLDSNFGLFVDTYFYRELMIRTKEPIGCLKARQIIALLELTPNQYDQYLQRIEPIRYNNNALLSLIQTANPILRTIIKRLFEQAKLHHLHQTQIHVVLKDTIPIRFKNKLAMAVKKFVDPNINSVDIMTEIFWIAQASEILSLRKRILYINVGSVLLDPLKDGLSNSFESYYANFRDQKTTVHQYLTAHNGMNGELDVLHDTMIVDWKASKRLDVMLEWVIQLLLYVYLCRENKKRVDSIAIYNPLSGMMNKCLLDKWNRGFALANYVIKKVDGQ